jgi:bifunctional aspartokinase / homoserine dehydrogenase 1
MDDNGSRLGVVVSAMGGQPKTTDLLLSAVATAAERGDIEVVLQQVRVKHETCLKELFPDGNGYERLLSIILQDLDDIRDILKTVSLMKWQAHRIEELVSGYGELWSTQILTQLLGADEFTYLDARRLIVVDESQTYVNGAICWDACHNNLQTLKIPTPHFVMTGYVASNTDGVATTLQRDGSDYSAAILGRLISATAITIWTDVDGVLSADPRRVPLAQVVPEVSFNEAMELAYFGAKVIHPKTMQPAITANIPIYIRNTFNPALPGSRIFTSTSTTGDKMVCAFSSIENIALINVEGSGLLGVLGVAKRLFGTLEGRGINVILISQASSEHSITFATSERQAEEAKRVIEAEFFRELEQNHINAIDVRSPCAIIAAVGDGMTSTMGCSGRFFSSLGDAKVNVLAIAQGCSERNISAVVAKADSVRALRAVHSAFQLSHSIIRIAIVGMDDVGMSLLRLLGDQRSSVRSTFDVDLQVCAVVGDEKQRQLVCLINDTDSSTESITMHAYESCVAKLQAIPEDTELKNAKVDDEKDTAKVVSGGPETLLDVLVQDTCSNHVVFDCTNSGEVSLQHANWLRSHVNVVTANNTGLSGPKEQRNEIKLAERMHGKQSAKYLREVTVGGGLPILKTMRSLLDTGDKIRRIDGILSVSLSFIMFRISPPPNFEKCSAFDEESSRLAFKSVVTTGLDTACSFSQAVKEAIELRLMEEDPTHDLDNEYTCRVLMVLAKELGWGDDIELSQVQERSEKVLDGLVVDYNNLTDEVDEVVRKRVEQAKSRGCVLRHISSVDVREKSLDIKIVEVPYEHTFATTPPSCECVRLFTDRHLSYPLIITGPSAGADSTASALLAELLFLSRGKASPQTVALSRTSSKLL